MLYLLYHHLLDGFFDVLDFLSLVTINQHDLADEYRYLINHSFLLGIFVFKKDHTKPIRKLIL